MRRSNPWSAAWSSTGPLRTVSTGSTLVARANCSNSLASVRLSLPRTLTSYMKLINDCLDMSVDGDTVVRAPRAVVTPRG
jgi:hypothetical protein